MPTVGFWKQFFGAIDFFYLISLWNCFLLIAILLWFLLHIFFYHSLSYSKTLYVCVFLCVCFVKLHMYVCISRVLENIYKWLKLSNLNPFCYGFSHFFSLALNLILALCWLNASIVFARFYYFLNFNLKIV